MHQAFEMWEEPKGQARFCFAHVGKDFSTGVLNMKPDTEVPKHNRPDAEENLLQISGRCQVTLYSEDGEIEATYDLTPGTAIHMKKGQWHRHSNPFPETSITQFKAEGDITGIVDKMRREYTQITPDEAQSQV
jgi:quercetin dioxygenase-like cupin family protein